MQRSGVVAAFAALALALAPGPALARGDAAPAPSASIAMFEGKPIDLSKGWGDAQACVVYQAAGIAECFRTSEGLATRERQLEAQIAASRTATAAAGCSSPLRLFASANYAGRELHFYDRGYWQNLSTWSFDNQLSSYKVGACGVYLADLGAGGGSWYPGSTSAGRSAASMLSGWNDRISSIFIQ